ncbi:hypothetical protein [Pseudarthrobacter sp. LT1]|uniref:hypothetical protein n=1 Tax=Pseudarthrobacter sp. LT1 TaxID=3111450 RepID=UPI002D796AAD|nr:hypothetical protein [Pseudarthrobacter sp. LT1]WRT12517.1 hypothetical protein VIK36_14230 [Pseudarthrobacter sp. LT1]
MSGFSTTAAFPNALMWLMSEDDQELVIPEIDGVANFWTSQNAWGVAVQHDAEGEVELTIGPNPPEDPSLMQLHEGILHTGRRLIDVQTVYLDSIARFRTRSEDTPIRIWGDDPKQPEHVQIQCPDIEEML